MRACTDYLLKAQGWSDEVRDEVGDELSDELRDEVKDEVGNNKPREGSLNP